jgi:arginine decarboxylase
VPGHKGGELADAEFRAAVGEAALALDVPAGIAGIDTGHDPAGNPLGRAQALAAEAWGAKRSWFVINGGSSGNHAICMALAHLGKRVVVQRNVHTSTIDGIVLGGLDPHFIPAEIDPQLGVAHCIAPQALASTLACEPAAVAALIVSPTYFGAVADVAGLVNVAHSHSVPLVVDEAWGSHLNFSPELPPSALESGADLVLSSVHKILGSMTQSAMLHLGHNAVGLDERLIDRSITLLESTSPNALLTASLDAARRHAATNGPDLLGRTISSLETLRRQLRRIPGLEVLDERLVGRPGVFDYDPFRLVIDVRGTGVSGQRLSADLLEIDDIHLELATDRLIVATVGIGERADQTGERLVETLRQALRRAGNVEQRAGTTPPPLAAWGPRVLTPRRAFLARHDVVPFDEAEGRIAGESLAVYPPGVPTLVPGERITRASLDYLGAALARGAVVRGATDRTLETLHVVA